MFGKIGVHVAGGATTAQLLRKETALLVTEKLKMITLRSRKTSIRRWTMLRQEESLKNADMT